MAIGKIIASNVASLERRHRRTKVLGTTLVILYFVAAISGLKWVADRTRNPELLAQAALDATLNGPDETRDQLLGGLRRASREGARLAGSELPEAPRVVFREFQEEIAHENRTLAEDLDASKTLESIFSKRESELAGALEDVRQDASSKALETVMKESVREELVELRGEGRRGSFDAFVALGGLIHTIESEEPLIPERRFEKLVLTAAGMLVDEEQSRRARRKRR